MRSQDTYVTVTPAGIITFDFAGHISADGIDIDAGTDSSPPNDRRIRWLRLSDGAVVASIYGYESGASDVLLLNAGGLGNNGAIASLTASAGGTGGTLAYNLVNSANAFARIGSGATAAHGETRAYAQDGVGTVYERMPIDGSGKSDFVGTVQQNCTLSGPYNSTGTGSLAPAAEVNVTITHNLGLTLQQQTDLVIMGHIVDVGFASQLGWRIQSQTANVVTVNIRNNGTVNNASGSLRVMLATSNFL